MTYVCFYHATEDSVEHAITSVGLGAFVALHPFARILSWIPLAGKDVEHVAQTDDLPFLAMA